MTTKRVWPDVAIPPGEILAEELETRGLTQSELARRMGRPAQAINEIVRGSKQVTGRTALELAAVLGVAAEFWMRLEADHQLARARIDMRQTKVRPRPGRPRRGRGSPSAWWTPSSGPRRAWLTATQARRSVGRFCKGKPHLIVMATSVFVLLSWVRLPSGA